MNLFNLERTFNQAAIKKWDMMYLLCDVHGVLIPNSWHPAKGNEFKWISEDAIEVLKWFSNRKDFKIIIWTASYAGETALLIDWMATFGITVSYVNSNPECKNTEYADFSYKPYYNILLDDKAGFEPATDWAAIKRELIRLGQWERASVL